MDDFNKTINEIKDLADVIAKCPNTGSVDIAEALRKVAELLDRLNRRTAGTSPNYFIGGCKNR